MARGSAGRLQSAPARQGAGRCRSMEQSQQVPMGRASSPFGGICFITQTSELGSPNTPEPLPLCNPCQLLAESPGKEMFWRRHWRGGELFSGGRVVQIVLISFHLTWAVSFSCLCVYMQDLFQNKKFLSGCIAGICCALPGTACLV